MSSIQKKPPYLWAIFNNKCPRCRSGKLFVQNNAYNWKDMVTMNEQCPECGQPTEIEVGFYYGTSYVSYALAVALSVSTFVAWWVLLGFSVKDNSIFYWLGVNAFFLIIMQPPLMRISRTLWLSWFVKYDPDWKEHEIAHYERVNKEHNW